MEGVKEILEEKVETVEIEKMEEKEPTEEEKDWGHWWKRKPAALALAL